jgi:hypothetical protein
VDVAIDVFDRMIDNGVLIVSLQSIVGKKFVTEDSGASFDVLAAIAPSQLRNLSSEWESRVNT